MTIYILVRLNSDCKIETYIMTDKDINYDYTFHKLLDEGWQLSNTRKIEEEIMNDSR